MNKKLQAVTNMKYSCRFNRGKSP